MAMMDYAMLPPEVNSGRMYAGAGSGPMTAAAAAWDGLATQLSSTADSYQAIIAGLTDGAWQGSASASMATAVEPYIAWISTTAVQAEQTAGQARAAAAAYEAAFAATVPPAVVAANRAMLATLVATNFFGQNTPAIAANQAEYAEMWAQDATAMYTYAAGTAAATTLTPLTAAPRTTNDSGTAGRAAAVGQSVAATSGQGSSAVPQLLNFLQNPFGTLANSVLFNNATTEGLNSLGGSFGTLMLQSSGPLFVSEAVQLFELPLMTATGKLSMLGPLAAAGAATGVGLTSEVSPAASALTLASSYEPVASASVGQAVPVGKLSVPPAWGMSPEARLTAAALPVTGAQPTPAPVMSAPFMGPVGSVINTPKNGDARPGPKTTSRPGGQADAADTGHNQWAQGAPDAEAGLSDRELAELDRLRDEMGELAMECDAMAQLMREAMR